MDVIINKLLPDYELIDCGNHKKIERFGDKIVIRPEISAENIPKLSNNEWKNKADAEFQSKDNSVYGKWLLNKENSEKWHFCYKSNDSDISVLLKLTNTKHIGIFPEQVINWKFIENHSIHKNNNKILNLFAYTGLASLVAASCGYYVTHIDSIKKTVDWGKSNMLNSNLQNIRWIVDDAAKFVHKEIRRNNIYAGIIADPPATGKGPKGEIWVLEKNLEKFIINIKVLTMNNSFIILNLYSHTINIKYLHKLILKYFSGWQTEFCDNIYGQSSFGDKIFHGFLLRLIRQ